jgi:hypothetical protein
MELRSLFNGFQWCSTGKIFVILNLPVVHVLEGKDFSSLINWYGVPDFSSLINWYEAITNIVPIVKQKRQMKIWHPIPVYK